MRPLAARAIAAESASKRMGLLTKSSMPAASQRVRAVD
ncbi:MAG: hypothetical protein RI897_4236 [Verrucomicrobiota bacterium]